MQKGRVSSRTELPTSYIFWQTPHRPLQMTMYSLHVDHPIHLLYAFKVVSITHETTLEWI